MKSINVPLDDARQYDLARWTRATTWDTHFPKDKLVHVLKTFLHGLGIDLDKQANVELDTADRPKKVPRAFCTTLRIPDEVKLVLKPTGGQGDYQTILHEAGHTEHYAHTRADLPYELQHFGPYNVTESYAFLFEYLMTDPLWLQHHLKMKTKQANDFARFLMLEKLFFFRRYCAKVIYELKLHRNDLRMLDAHFKPTAKTYKTMADCYADIQRRATKIRYVKTNYLLDVDGGMYSAEYVQAWLMEAMLKTELRKRFGPNWWTSADAGDFLKHLWATGTTGRTIEELAHEIGANGLSIEPMTTEFLEEFK
jgi:hypothetical protein